MFKLSLYLRYLVYTNYLYISIEKEITISPKHINFKSHNNNNIKQPSLTFKDTL